MLYYKGRRIMEMNVFIDQSVAKYVNTYDDTTGKSKYVLHKTTDSDGNTVINAEKKGIITWLKAHTFWGAEYDLNKIYNAVTSGKVTKPSDLNTERFAVIFGTKISKYDARREVAESRQETVINTIRDLFAEKLIAREEPPPVEPQIITQEPAVETAEATQEVEVPSPVAPAEPPMRRAVPKISALFQEHVSQAVSTYLQLEENLQSLPQAEGGRAAVFLPKELPIVIKCPRENQSEEDIQNRLEKMYKARELCEEHHISNISVPEGHMHGPFIIESRIPFKSNNTIQQIGLYCENREKFTQVAKEFVRLLCFGETKDFVGNTESVFSRLAEKGLQPRFDNIPIYIENGIGKMGLVDTEDFTPRTTKPTTSEVLTAVNWALRVFPFHKDAIVEEALKVDPEIANHMKDIDAYQQSGEEYYQLMYEGHKDFLNARGIDPAHAAQPVEVKAERREQVKQILYPEIVSFLTDYNQSEDFPITPEREQKIRQCLQQHADTLIDYMLAMVNDKLASEHKAISSKTAQEELSLPQIATCRTFHLKLREAYDALFGDDPFESFKGLTTFGAFVQELIPRERMKRGTEQVRQALFFDIGVNFLTKITPALLSALQGEEIYSCKKPYPHIPDQVTLFC